MNKIILVIMIVLLFPVQSYAYESYDKISYIDGTLDEQANNKLIEYTAMLIKLGKPKCDPYFIYQFVIDYMDYDEIKFSNKEKYTYSAATALIEHKGTCVDYSLLYNALCRALGYECNIVVGGINPHMWNEVYYNDKWIQIDTTRRFYTDSNFDDYIDYKIK